MSSRSLVQQESFETFHPYLSLIVYQKPYKTRKDEKQHYWEVLPTTLLTELTEFKLDKIISRFATVTSSLFVEANGNLNLVLQVSSTSTFNPCGRRGNNSVRGFTQ